MFAPIDFVQSLESCYELGLDCDALQLRLGLGVIIHSIGWSKFGALSCFVFHSFTVLGAYYVIRLVLHRFHFFFRVKVLQRLILIPRYLLC